MPGKDPPVETEARRVAAKGGQRGQPSDTYQVWGHFSCWAGEALGLDRGGSCTVLCA